MRQAGTSDSTCSNALLDGSDAARIVGPDALAVGWEELRDRYGATLNA